MADERTLRALLRFGIDKANVNEAKRGVKDIERSLKDVEQQMNKLRESGEMISGVGMRLTAFGAALSGPFILAARSYVQYAGYADASSRRWLAATDDLERSTMRIGKVAAEQLVPFLETAADLMEKVADFAENNPSAIKAAVFIGGAAAGLGTLATTVGQLAVTVSAIGKIAAGLGLIGGGGAAAAGAAGAAGTAGTAALSGEAALAAMGGGPLAAGAAGAGGLTAGGVGLAAAGGLAAGFGVNELIARSEWGKSQGFQTFGKFASVGAYGAGKLLGGEEMGKEWFAAIADLTGETQGLADTLRGTKAAAEGAGGIEDEIIPQAALDAYIAYQKDVEEMERQHGEARLAIIEDYNDQIEAVTESYEERRAQIVEDYEERRDQATADFERRRERVERDFNRSRELAAADFAASQVGAAADFTRQESEAENSYYANRAKRARDFGIEMARMEEDHQRQMRDLQEDHAARTVDLISSRDALGLVREQRSYERERRRAEEDYLVRASQRNEDFAREMGDMEQNFREQRAARLADFERRQKEAQAAYDTRRRLELEEYEQRQADEQEDFDLRQEQEKKHNADMLLELNTQHTDELRQMEDHKNEVLDELNSQHRSELDRRTTAFRNQLNALDAHLLGEQVTAQAYYAMMETDFRTWLVRMRSQVQGGGLGGSTPAAGAAGAAAGANIGAPFLQHGGYTRRGLAYLHDREFVLNPDTTQAAERMAMGRLTQERALAMMAGGGASGSSRGEMTIQIDQSNWGFNGAFSEQEKRWYKQVAYEQAEQAVLDVVSGNM